MNPQDQNGGQYTGSGQSSTPLPTNPQQPAQQPYYGQSVNPSQPAQAYPPQQATHNPAQQPYEFILNPQQAPKSNGLVGILRGGSILKLVGLIGGAAIVLIIVIVALSSLLGGGKDYSTLVVVAEDQAELIRIATLGTSSATGQSTQNVAYNAKLSLTSNQQQLLAYLSSNGKKVSVKQLALKQNAGSTTTLKNAIATSTFDSAFNDVMKTDLTTYMKDLSTAYKTNPGPKGKVLLSKTYNQAELLQAQLTQANGD